MIRSDNRTLQFFMGWRRWLDRNTHVTGCRESLGPREWTGFRAEHSLSVLVRGYVHRRRTPIACQSSLLFLDGEPGRPYERTHT